MPPSDTSLLPSNFTPQEHFSTHEARKMIKRLVTQVVTMYAASATASPTSLTSFITGRAVSNAAAAQLLAIAPTSNTCTGAAYPTECETATTAAPYLISAMTDYGIYTLPEIAALLSLIAYETGDFKYAKNHFPAPGRPGQGTRNLQMAAYNLQYALSIPALKAKAMAVAPSGTITGLSDDALNEILALVLPDQYSWASAAWYYRTFCGDVRSEVQTGSQAGWTAYLGCVGTTATSDRTAYWIRANAAFGIS